MSTLVIYVQAQVARIAGISDFQIDLDQPLSDLGFDSLMAVELRNQLITELAAEIPLQTILENSSVNSLADRVQQLASQPLPTPAILGDILGDIDSPQTGTQRCPLSQGQWGLWFLHQLAPKSAAYNVAFTARICSQVNVAALKRSLQVLIDRHPTLRTIFVQGSILGQGKGDLVQEIQPTQPLDFEQIDAANWDEETLTRRAIEIYQRPFDLASSVLRVTLLSQSPQHHVLILNIHHIAIDGMSFGVLLSELQLLYQAESIGQPVALPVIDYQYTDFVQWQHEMVNSAVGEALWQYWQQRLQDVPPLILPSDRPRTPLQSHAGASYSFELSEALTAQLRALAKAERTTLYTVLLTAFQVLLYRYTGQEDIVVGTPASGRSQTAFAQTVGFFVNMIALRTNLAGNPLLTELLAQVRSIVLEAIEHQSYPAPLLVERLGMNRDLSLPGLFRASFNLLNLPKMASDFELSISSRTSAQWGDLLLEPFEIPQQEGQNDLVFDIMETTDRLIGIFRYSPALFDDATIHRMADRFQTLLEGIIANPQQPIRQLPFLTRSEQSLLMAWGAPKANYPVDLCIHQLFEMQVELSPDAIAIVCGEQSITYQQLNLQAHQLAHHLRNLGVIPEVRVGICLDRSVEILVAVLAVLKAGAAYVPLDPNYPAERLSFMLADAEVTLLLTQQDLADQLSCDKILCLDSLCLDNGGTAIAPADERNFAANLTGVAPENLAYIVYTSGSTGKAKGVMVEHCSLVNAYFAWKDAYGLSDLSSHLQMASFSFDVFTGDWVRALCSGAKLVLCPQEWLLEPESLYPLMQEQAIDTAEFGPAVLRNLMLYLRQSKQTLEFMRLLAVGSDAFYVQEYDSLKQLCAPQTRLINSYGVSEATIDSTYFDMTCLEEGLDASAMMPIGRPFANTQIFLLDTDLQPVPIEVTGELYIGGAGLARGYLNRPDLTAQAFRIYPDLPNLLPALLPGQRLYKTGDRARYLSDGTLEYLGRSDTQIKLRGFRIELGEIEAVLGQHPAVQQSVVVVREDSFSMQSLVAYLVADANQDLSIPDLRAFLKQKLPDPMMPSAFMVLETLPLNANGKVDRRALPAPDRFQRDMDVGFVAPQTSIERRIAEIWQRILKLDRVGIHDNFFELGGHSLLATQAMAQLCQVFHIDVPLRVLFEFPTIAQLGERIESSHQTRSIPAIEPADRSIGYTSDGTRELPLSYAQESLWFLNQLEGIGSTYNMPMPLRLTGKLNIAILEQSLAALVQRHEILRTTFPVHNRKPVQVIAPDGAVDLPVVNLQNLPEAEQEQQLQQWIAAEVNTPFDLAAGRLLKGTVLQLSETDNVLLLTLHHIVADGWSIEVFVRELAALYTAFVSDQPSPLSPLPIQYADFALWQRRYLQGEVLDMLLAHWQRTLRGAPPMLALPTDYPRPAVQTYHGQSTVFELNSTLAAALKALSQEAHVTLFMTLLSAFYVLLHHYTQQDDLVVGTPIANRNRAETAGLIGYFVNILVLRTDLSGNPSFKEVLARVYQMALDAYSYQDLPFEKLVEALQPERSLSHTPLFQVMFALHNAPTPELNLPDLTIRGLDLDIITSKFDLTIAFRETESGLIGFVEYNTDLFEAATIERLMGHYQQLLQEIVTAPNHRLSELSLLTPAEQQQFAAWNHTQVDYPDLCIHQLFEAQVEQTPDAIAVVLGDCSSNLSFTSQQFLTYQQLNIQANRLAHFLQAQGIALEDRVGICLERSVEMLVAVLAVLKAGAAYVPLDPNYPPDRLSFMLADVQATFLLTQKKFSDRLPPEIPTFCLDQQSTSQGNEANLKCAIAPANLAYVVYTSGSTGRAKGVMVEHRSLVNAYFAWEDAYQLSALSSHLQMASFSFDVFTGDWVRALCSGAKLVLCPYEYLLEPARLYSLMQTATIDCAEFSPVVLRLLVQYLQNTEQNAEQNPEQTLAFMKLLVVGSDSFYLEDYQALQQLCSSETRLVNSYGVSEATIDSTYFEPTQLDRSINGMMPIGRPFKNTQIHLFSADLQPVPVGIAGEIYIAGAGLARGYLNQPTLTAERFVTHPLSGERLYRTGDLARYLNDGTIELLGRCDHQVKLRGFRIEIGEIEALLTQHPQVEAAAVVLQTIGLQKSDLQKAGLQNDQGSDQDLVAYVVSSSAATEPLSVSTLRAFLKAKLPSYMVPANFVWLDTLPLTPNGKVDRRALPVPERSQREVEAGLIAPRNSIERRIAEVWVTVLKLDRVGIHDNFFELGGHSLLATQVIAQLCQVFQTNLPLRLLFESPTIAALGEQIESNYQETLAVTAIEPTDQSGELPLSYAQESLWFLDQLEGIGPTYNLPMPMRLTGTLDIAALEYSLVTLQQRHSVLRTAFPAEAQPTQIISPESQLPLPIIDLQAVPPDQQEAQLRHLVFEQAKERFDLATGSLMRVTLFRLSAQDHLLLITLHHIVADGWSIEIFAREFGTLYSAFVNGQPCPLPDLPIQYADFALWQRRYLQGEVLEALLAHWQRTLAGAPPIVTLPTDYPRPAVQTFRGQSASFPVDASTTESLKSLSQQSKVTLFMTLLAAFQVLLSRYSGQDDIVVGSPIANRNRAETAGLIGYFVNILVLRTDLSGNPSFKEVLARVYQVALDAYSYQDLPFEMLVKALQPERSLSHTPLFQVMFVLQNAPTPELHLPNLTIRGFDLDIITSKFDVTMALQETEQGLIGFVEYNTDLFKPETIERLMGHYQQLLQAIAAAPERRLSELSILTPAEQQQFTAWNRTQIDYPRDLCIHQLFEAQVKQTPEAIAVVSDRQHLTYHQLNIQANQLAHALQLEAETRVGICLERSVELLVAVLAVLKAGGTYVSLDPNYPPDRLSWMLEDAQVSVLLTHSTLIDRFADRQIQIICLDGNQEAIAPEHNPNLASTSDHLAYIIYTSGSTGRAKGVMVEHRSLVNAYFAWRDAYRLPDLSSHLQMASFSFDVFTGDWVRALCSGTKLVLCPYEYLLEAKSLYALMQQQQIDTAEFSPAVLRNLMQYLQDTQQRLDFMRMLVVGSDSFYVQEYQALQQLCSAQTCLINSYGVSEATIDSTYFEMTCIDNESDYESANRLVPIGRPFANTQIYILDTALQPVPIGVTGELYLGGAGLARGYLNQPQLTQQRFIQHPMGSRLYKTGDLACYRSDGTIELLGRSDYQVKLRGFRIELEEIEALLRQHPAVREAIATLQGEDDKRIVAYIVPNVPSHTASDPEPSLTTSLRSFLKTKLPHYMLPGSFVLLDAMPLTPNGKIDRKVLPAPENPSRDVEESFVPPSTPIEQTLAELWVELLQVSQVGVTDNFFDLGGHSLLATSLVFRICKAFSIEFPLRYLFEAPTIAAQSKLIEQIQATRKPEADLPKMLPLLKRPAEAPIPLSLSQQYLWYLHQKFNREGSDLNSSAVVRLRAALSPEVLEQSCNEIIRRHEILRTVFSITAGQPTQVVLPTLSLTVFYADLQSLPTADREAEAVRLGIKTAQPPFDLASAPLIRVAQFQLAPQEHWLLITMHHIITDGWSFGIFLQELDTLIRAFSSGLPSPLPALSIQYADFSVWQQQICAQGANQLDLDYWQHKLVGSIPELTSESTSKPSEPSNSIAQSPQAGHYFTHIPESTSAAVESLSRSQKITTFVILLAALKITLSRSSGQREIMVIATVGNRTIPETEPMIGCFINDVILRSLISLDETGLDLMHQLRETVNEAIDHKDAPFQQVIEQTRRYRDLNLMASLTMSSAAQSFDQLPDWEVVDLRDKRSHWDDLSSELYDETTPLELYVELSDTIRIIVNYSLEQFTAEAVDRLFAVYEAVLTQLVTHPHTTLAELFSVELFSVNSQPCEEPI